MRASPVESNTERERRLNHTPSFSNKDFIRTFSANGMCMTSYTERKSKKSAKCEGGQHNLVVSDLVVDIRLCKLFRGFALIPRLYCFLRILRNCQIQPVHASSGRCVNLLDGEGSCTRRALTCPCLLHHKGCLYCFPPTEMH